MHKMRTLFARIGILLLASITLLAGQLVPTTVLAVYSVPHRMIYNSRLLNPGGSPITSQHTVRFTFWIGANAVPSDLTGTGAINYSAPNFVGWKEEQNFTPNNNGYFYLEMGSINPLPSFGNLPASTLSNLFMQVEVKPVGTPDSAYEILDPKPSDNSVDRSPVLSVPFAINADHLNQREIGTGSGSIPLLGPGGKVGVAQMGSGTLTQSFTINAGNVAGDTTLTFGNALLPETLKFSATNSRFEFSDDVYVQNTLTASGSIATNSGMTINADNSVHDAVLTFGNNVAPETLRFSNADHQFTFSDDVQVSGNLTVTGTINGLTLNPATLTPLQVTAGGGLTVSVASGSYRLGSALVSYPGAAGFNLAANASNYVFFGSGGLTARTAGFPTDEGFIPLAVVQTATGAVTGVADKRTLQTDIREQDVTDVLTPEFDKATYQGDALNNVGTMSMSQDNATKRNYYMWSSTQASLQDYDVFVRFQLPRDFVRFQASGTVNPLQVQYRSTSASASDNALDIALYDTNGNPVSLSGATTGLASTSWATSSIDLNPGSTWTAGQEFLLKFHMSARTTAQMHLGSVTLKYTVLKGQ